MSGESMNSTQKMIVKDAIKQFGVEQVLYQSGAKESDIFEGCFELLVNAAKRKQSAIAEVRIEIARTAFKTQEIREV